MMWMMWTLLACSGTDQDTGDTGRDPVACDIVQATESCPRLLVCCTDVETCWVETAEEVMDCDVDGCTEALAAVCGS